MEIVDVIKKNVKESVKKLYDLDLEEVSVEHPENSEFGDYSTNVALGLAKMVKQSPLSIAKNISYELQEKLHTNSFVVNDIPIFSFIDFAPPGFINFKLSSHGYKVYSMR